MLNVNLLVVIIQLLNDFSVYIEKYCESLECYMHIIGDICIIWIFKKYGLHCYMMYMRLCVIPERHGNFCIPSCAPDVLCSADCLKLIMDDRSHMTKYQTRINLHSNVYNGIKEIVATVYTYAFLYGVYTVYIRVASCTKKRRFIIFTNGRTPLHEQVVDKL